MRLFGWLSSPPQNKREQLVAKVARELGGNIDPAHLRALLEVPRELFVRKEDTARSAEDVALPLDEVGLATISAPHAYLLSFRLLGLAAGDHLVELGSGSGYGAALAAHIVGESGSVATFEIDPLLVTWATTLLGRERNVTVIEQDAVASAHLWGEAKKIVCTFAVDAIPQAWLDAIPEGGALVAPVGPSGRDQRLVRVTREGGQLSTHDHCAVRYVRNRSTL